MTKFKKRKEEQMQQKIKNSCTTIGSKVINASQNSKTINLVSERFSKIFKKTKKKKISSATLQRNENTSKINCNII